MINSSETPKRSLTLAALAAATAFFMPSLASAQEVTLKSADGAVSITGELIEFSDDAYIINSPYGPLRVAADRVDCFGDGYPSAAASDTVVWQVSLWGKRRAFTEHVERLAELVAEKSEGDFTLDIHYGDLAASNENLDGLKANSFEMAQFCAGYHPDKNPSLTVLELPFLGVGSLEQEIEVSMAVYEHPAVVADMARWNATLLMPSPLPQYNLIGAGLPPTSLDDFKGMTIRASGGIGDAVASLGAELVTIPADGVRDAMNDGTVRAVSFAPHAHMSFNTIDRGSWWTTNLNPGTVNCPVVVNTEAFEALSPENREILEGSVEESLRHYISVYNGQTMDAWLPALRERGIIELTINNQILSSINEAVAAPAAATWIAENSVLGLPAKDIYDLMIQTVAKGS